MKLITRLTINAILPAGAAVIIALVFILAFQEEGMMIKRNSAANKVLRGMFELNLVTHDYLQYKSDRSRLQWQSKHNSLSGLLKLLEFERPEEQAILSEVVKYHESIALHFVQLVELHGGHSGGHSGEGQGSIISEIQNRLTGQLLMKSQAMVSGVARLTEMCYADMLAAEKEVAFLVLGLIGALVVITVSSNIVMGRSILKPVRQLREGTEIIGSGNLDYRIGSAEEDEMGRLSRAFDRMADNLKTTTVSRDRLEEIVRERTDSLSEAQRIAHLGNWDWDIVKNELKWSDEIYRIFGLKPQEFRANYEAFLNSIHPDDREFVKQAVNEAVFEKKPYSIDHRIVLPNGEERIVHEQAEVSFNDNGKAVRMVGTVQDITERKRAEEALNKSVERFDLAVRGANDGLWDWDIAGNELYLAPRFKELLGYEDHEMENNFENWETRLHPEDHDRTMKAISDHFENKVPYSEEYRLRVKSGEHRWFLARGQALYDEAGKAFRMSGSISDITERKGAEDDLRKRTHDLGERMKELRCTYEASRLMANTEHSFKEVITGVINLIPPSWQYPEITCARIILNGQQFMTDEFQETEWKQSADISVSSKTEGALEVYYMEEKPPAYDGPFVKEERDLIDALARDMGKFIERQRAQQELGKSQAMLAQSEKMSAVGTMVAGVAHELNNPLMGMTNYVQYCLKHTSGDDRRYRVLRDIDHETNRCIEIVRNLLTFSRLEQENGAEYRAEDLPVVLDRVLKLLNYRIGAHNINVTTRIAEGIPRVWIKSFKVQQVFLNILVNAMDALQDSDKKDISIDMRHESESVQISFADTGPGIASENLQRVFDPFFTTKPPGKGTGLGLSISYGIINEHGGEITAESVTGEGTKINITLPVKSNG